MLQPRLFRAKVRFFSFFPPIASASLLDLRVLLFANRRHSSTRSGKSIDVRYPAGHRPLEFPMLPVSSRFKFSDDFEICRILNGMWQVSGAHGYVEPERGVSEMFRYHEAGFTTWDLADHYGPAEDFIGEFRRQLAATRGPGALTTMQAFTKWVPQPGPMTRPIVENNVAISLRRMGV